MKSSTRLIFRHLIVESVLCHLCIFIPVEARKICNCDLHVGFKTVDCTPVEDKQSITTKQLTQSILRTFWRQKIDQLIWVNVSSHRWGGGCCLWLAEQSIWDSYGTCVATLSGEAHFKQLQHLKPHTKQKSTNSIDCPWWATRRLSAHHRIYILTVL